MKLLAIGAIVWLAFMSFGGSLVGVTAGVVLAVLFIGKR